MRDSPRSTEVQWLFSRGSIYLVALGLQLSAGLLVTPLATRILAPAEFGEAATAIIVAQFLSSIVAFGMPNAITRLYFAADNGKRSTGGLLLFNAVGALILIAVLDLLGPLWFPTVAGTDYTGAFRLGVWCALPFGLLMGSQAYLRATDAAALFAVSSALASVGSHLFGSGLAALHRPTGASYMVGVLMGYAVAVLATTPALPLRQLHVPASTLLRRALRLGLPTIPHQFSTWVIALSDRIIIQHFLVFAAVGRYHVAYLAGAVGVSLLGALNNVWGPLIYGADDQNRWDLLAESTAAIYRTAALVTGILALAAPFILGILAPDSYDVTALAPLTALITVTLMTQVRYVACLLIVLQLERAGVLAWLTPTMAAGNILLNLALIPHFELYGAAIATVAAFGTRTVVLAIHTRRFVQVPWDWATERGAWFVALAAVTAAVLLPESNPALAVRAMLLTGFAVFLAREARAIYLSRPASP